MMLRSAGNGRTLPVMANSDRSLQCYGSLGSRQCSVRKAPVVVGSPPSFSSGQSNHRALPADPSSGRSSSSFHKQAGPALDRFPVYNHPASSATVSAIVSNLVFPAVLYVLTRVLLTSNLAWRLVLCPGNAPRLFV